MASIIEMRKRDELERWGAKIEIPITIIHGDYDPHPSTGVIDPLSRYYPDKSQLKSYILPKCGHSPWSEKQASEEFYTILRKEIFI